MYSWAKQEHYESGILPGYLVASKDQIAKFIFDLQTPRWLAQTRKSLQPQNSWAEQAAC